MTNAKEVVVDLRRTEADVTPVSSVDTAEDYEYLGVHTEHDAEDVPWDCGFYCYPVCCGVPV